MFSIMSPSECASALRNRISKEQRIAFISTFIIGFFCHLFIMTNSMYNNDDIRYLYVTLDKLDLGRWLQTYAGGISSYFSLPVVNGILTLIYASIGMMILVHMFQLKNRIGIVLVSGLFITFPSMASMYSFAFTTDSALICFLLCIIAAYYVTRNSSKWDWVIGAFFLCASLGVYQGYLHFTLLLMLLHFILLLLQPEKKSDKELFILGIRYVLMLALGMVLYYIGLTITLNIKNAELSSYMGMNESSIPGLNEIKNRLVMIFTDFVQFFKTDQVLAFNRWMQASLIISIILLIIFFFTMYLKNKVYKSIFRNIMLIFCFFCIPISVNVLYLISDKIAYHVLMRHGWCLLFIAVIILFEKASPYFKLSSKKCLEWCTVISLFLVVWNYILLSNIGYFNMNFRYEKTYALCLKIMDRIEQSEDYDRHRPIAFIGNYSKTYQMEATEEILVNMTGMSGDRIFKGASRAYLPFFQNCIGEDITVVTPEEEEILRNHPEFLEMPYFPKPGSIKIIDDVTVVKLND